MYIDINRVRRGVYEVLVVNKSDEIVEVIGLVFDGVPAEEHACWRDEQTTYYKVNPGQSIARELVSTLGGERLPKCISVSWLNAAGNLHSRQVWPASKYPHATAP